MSFNTEDYPGVEKTVPPQTRGFRFKVMPNRPLESGLFVRAPARNSSILNREPRPLAVRSTTR